MCSMGASEEWRPVVGWEGTYEVSSLGRVRSLDRLVDSRGGSKRLVRGLLKTQTIDDIGRPQVGLSKPGYHRTKRVHRLVAEAFLGEPQEDQIVLHSNGDPSDNRVSNLRWGTHSENRLDSVKHGTHRQSSKSHCIRGHELIPPNLTPYSLRNGSRTCKACSWERIRAYRLDEPFNLKRSWLDYERIMENA